MSDILRVIFIVAVAGLWRLGGWKEADWSGYRDFCIPMILGIYYGFACNFWIGMLVAGAANTIRIGYGAYDPVNDKKPSWLAKVTKDKEGSLIRAIYGFITSFSIGVFPAIYKTVNGNKVAVFVFIGFVLGNILLEFTLNRLKANVWVTELGNGAGRGSILLCLR